MKRSLYKRLRDLLMFSKEGGEKKLIASSGFFDVSTGLRVHVQKGIFLMPRPSGRRVEEASIPQVQGPCENPNSESSNVGSVVGGVALVGGNWQTKAFRIQYTSDRYYYPTHNIA